MQYGFPAALLIAALGSPLPAQVVSVVEGSSPADLRLVTIDESSATPTITPVMRSFEARPIDFSNRTVQRSLRADCARLLEDQFPRIAIPVESGIGTLIRFSDNLSPREGLIWIQPNMPPEIAHEGPIGDFVGIGCDGGWLVTDTSDDELAIVSLRPAPGSYGAPRVRTVRVVGDLASESLCVGPSHVFFQASDRLYRCALAGNDQPQDVTPAGIVELESTMAMSEDGSRVVFIGETSADGLWLIESTGPARRLPTDPGEFVAPAYLPSSSTGPALLLNRDGSRLFYVDESGIETESFLMDTTGATTTTHLSSDANTAEYIGITVLPVFMANEIVVALGDEAASDPSISFDWYRARTGDPVVENITLTSVAQSVPFEPGTLSVEEAFGPVNGCLLVREQNGNGGTRMRCIGSDGSTRIMVPELAGRLRLGSGTGAPYMIIPNRAGDCLLSSDLRLMAQGPAGARLRPPARGPTGLLGLVAETSSAQTVGWLIDFAAGTMSAPVIRPGLEQLVPTVGGGFVINGDSMVHVSARGGLAYDAGFAQIRVVL